MFLLVTCLDYKQATSAQGLLLLSQWQHVLFKNLDNIQLQIAYWASFFLKSESAVNQHVVVSQQMISYRPQSYYLLNTAYCIYFSYVETTVNVNFFFQKHLVMKRSFLVLGLSVFAVFGSGVAGFPGSGGLCTLVLAFLAGLGWGTEKVIIYASKNYSTVHICLQFSN